MTAHILFYNEVSRYERTYEWIHKHCGMYGLVPVVIDPEARWPGKPYPGLPRLAYPSLQEVLGDARFLGCTFVWLDHGGTQYLDEYEHPTDNVVYCIGSDDTGFGGVQYDWSGPRLKLRQEGEFFANILVPIVCYDRWLYMQGRRR